MGGAALVLTLLMACVAPSPARAADGTPPERREFPFSLSADEVEYDQKRDLYVARGHVRIRQTDPERTLTADWVAFSRRTRKGVASGDVVLVEGPDTLHADMLQFEVDSARGVVFGARLESGKSGFRAEGDQVRKTGERTYVFERGVFTTCTCPDDGTDPWRIEAERGDVELEGGVVARNTTFQILGVPVVWLPWMYYPLRTERTTGLLLPEVNASSRSGLDVGVPFFWAARDDLNLTFTPSYIFDRGFMPKLDVEYVFGRESSSSLYAAFIDDRQIDSGDPATPFDAARWAVDFRHDHFLPADWRLQADVRLISDNEWPFDFHDFSENRIDRFIESKAFVTRHFGSTGRYGFTGAVHYADDLQSPDDTDRDRFMLQRAPDLRLMGLPAPLASELPLVTAFDVRYTNFTAFDDAEDEVRGAVSVDDIFLDAGIDALADGFERNSAGLVAPGDASADNFPGPERDGRFQEGEPLVDRGQRLVLNPRFSLPLQLGGIVELEPELGLHQTFYETDEQGFENRTFFTGRVDARTRLRGVADLPFLGEVVHVLEPRLGYAVIQQTSQSDNPLFIPRTATPQQRVRQLDLGNVTRDPADRIESYNGVTLGVGNRFYGRRLLGQPAAPASVGVAQVARPLADDEAARELAEAVAPGRASELLADVTLSTGYQFSGNEFGAAYLEAQLYPGAGLQSRFIAGYDIEETVLSEGLFEMGWSSPAGHDLFLTYRYLRDIPRFFESFRFDSDRFDDFEEGFDRVSQASLFARWAILSNWALSYSAAYSFEQSGFLTNNFGLEYISRCRCWAVRLEVGDHRTRGLDVGLRYTLLGLGADTVRPFSAGGSGLGLDRLGGG